jgi:betaine-aldehyde dehydrogenase
MPRRFRTDDPMTTYFAQNWITGAFVSSTMRRTSINPATYDSIGEYGDDGGAAAAAAIGAAACGFCGSGWAHDAELRASVLDQMAAAIERNCDRLIDILSLKNGKIRCEAALEVAAAPNKLRYWAAMARTEAGRTTRPKPCSL